jgi:glycosyltransferase involved in cell wall biosynthesis
MLGSEAGTGVATYARTLIDTLRLIDCDRHVLLETVGVKDKWAARRAALSPWRRAQIREICGEQDAVELYNRQLFAAAHMHFTLTGRLMPVRPPLPRGIMHWTYPVPLRLSGWRNIYTIHDVIPITHPTLSPVSPRRLRAVLARIRHTADRIVTVSETSRQSIVETLGWPDNFVVNCGQAVLPARNSDSALPAGLAPQGYFIYAGLIEPRKNIAGLLAAYVESGVETPLVIVGPEETTTRSLTAMIDATPHVRRLSYLPSEVLHTLIRQCKALLFPSFIEGFGLPIAEAMSAAVPVMTSDRGALAETAGGAAMLVDPNSIGQMAEAIGRLDRDAVLRARLSVAGAGHAHSFSQQGFARRIEHVYAAL